MKAFAHGSHSLKPVKKNYSQIGIEALAIIFAKKKCYKFILGRNFTLKTDYKLLLELHDSKKCTLTHITNRL